MFARLKRQAAPAADHPAAGTAAGAAGTAEADLQRMVQALAGQASTLGRESAEVRGAIDDTTRVAGAQAQLVQELAPQLRQVVASQQDIADEQANPLAQLQDHRMREALVEAIKHLPEREQYVMSMYYEHDMNLKEIAAVLGVTESRVCQLHSQSIARLRVKLREY